MRIGIDISQLAYTNTGVANYTKNLVENLIALDKENEYVLFYSSLRRNFQSSIFPAWGLASSKRHNSQSNAKRIKFKIFKFPPTLLDILWNKLHIIPIEWLIGDVDVFISSDWTQPPTKKAKRATILYDLIIYKYPEETDKRIIATQKRKLSWVKKECDMIFCISESTKHDVMELLEIEEKRLQVIYPGIS